MHGRVSKIKVSFWFDQLHRSPLQHIWFSCLVSLLEPVWVRTDHLSDLEHELGEIGSFQSMFFGQISLRSEPTAAERRICFSSLVPQNFRPRAETGSWLQSCSLSLFVFLSCSGYMALIHLGKVKTRICWLYATVHWLKPIILTGLKLKARLINSFS